VAREVEDLLRVRVEKEYHEEPVPKPVRKAVVTPG